MTTPSDLTSPPSVIRRDLPKESWFKRIFSFIGWIFSGFGLLNHLRRGHASADAVVVYTVHQAFYLWAMLLTGFIGSFYVRHWGGPTASVVWGWLYLWVLLYTLVTLLFDTSTIKFLLWVGIFGFIWLACRYLEDMKIMPVVTRALHYFSSQRPQLDPGFVTVISWLLLPAWIGSLFQTFSRGRKVFTPNSIEEWYLGEGSEVTDRSGLKFRTRYRDIFETALGLGAGDLEAVDGSGRVVKRWANILFLAFTWNRLDEILHQRAATVDNPKDEPIEVETVKREN